MGFKNLLARIGLAFLLAVGANCMARAEEPLSEWNDGAARTAIVTFVTEAVTPGSPGFIAPPERIAVFDNDGTLWTEQPKYFQGFFLFDRLRALAPGHPEWRTTEPFASALRGDDKAVLAGGEKALMALLAATHSGMSQEEFTAVVSDWLATAKHPRFQRRYDELVYAPMLQVMRYLRDNGFKTFIVSGGGIDFMRAFSERVYGVPTDQVIGSGLKLAFEMKDGKSAVVHQPQIDFIDDGPGKPVGIARHIGRRPVIAFGNSDGDLQMLQYVTGAGGPRLGLIVHHTDAQREYAYDRQSPFGRLDKALDMAGPNGWIIIDMKKDWKKVYSFE